MPDHNDPAPEKNAPAPTSGGWVQMLHEGIGAVIGIAVLGVTAWMLVQTFHAAGTAGTVEAAAVEAFNRQKDILHYGLALLGTVLGYYLGRVPAELRAQQAQHTA